MSAFGAKIGTKSWSDARQNELTKSDGIKTNSAQDLQKLGDQDIGDVLNKLSDPNYIDPRKKIRAVGSDKMDKDAFMKLMLAQMKNQDPSNPLKSHEMAAQLAQFTSLEQLQNMNTTLSSIEKGQKPTESFQALNFIGKSVSGDSAKIMRTKGDKDHELVFNLPEDGKEIHLKIKNEAGEVVRKIDIPTMKKGENRFVWNGKTDNDVTAPTGEYQVVVEAKGNNDKKLAVKTDFSGVITGVAYSAEGPVLMVGNQAVKLKDVRKIVDPSLTPKDSKDPIKDQIKAQVPQQDLKAQHPASENKDKEDKGAEEPKKMTSNIMDNVSMSGGMIEKLKKELTAPSTTESALAPEEKAPAQTNVLPNKVDPSATM